MPIKRPTKKAVSKKSQKPKPKKKSAKKNLAKIPPKPPKLVQTKQGLMEVKEKPVESKPKNSDKFVKVLSTESRDFFRDIGERVARKELKWMYYTIENSVGVHYYLILT